MPQFYLTIGYDVHFSTDFAIEANDFQHAQNIGERSFAHWTGEASELSAGAVNFDNGAFSTTNEKFNLSISAISNASTSIDFHRE